MPRHDTPPHRAARQRAASERTEDRARLRHRAKRCAVRVDQDDVRPRNHARYASSNRRPLALRRHGSLCRHRLHRGTSLAAAGQYIELNGTSDAARSTTSVRHRRHVARNMDCDALLRVRRQTVTEVSPERTRRAWPTIHNQRRARTPPSHRHYLVESASMTARSRQRARGRRPRRVNDRKRVRPRKDARSIVGRRRYPVEDDRQRDVVPAEGGASDSMSRAPPRRTNEGPWPRRARQRRRNVALREPSTGRLHRAWKASGFAKYAARSRFLVHEIVNPAPDLGRIRVG